MSDLIVIDDELLERATPEEQVSYLRYLVNAAEEDGDWAAWLHGIAPTHCTFPFAAHHGELWRWVWAIEADVKPAEAFVGVWARGAAKSTSAELAVVCLAARRKRRYGLYVSDTQAQADDHVAAIADLLESFGPVLALCYPALGERMVGRYGQSKGWRRNRLRMASGFTVDALGLDTAVRGVKIDEQRPDLVVLDDLDDSDDTTQVTERKLDALTRKVLPAGSEDLAVLAIQNLVIPDGVFARLAGVADEPAEFLARRQVSGPVPALRRMVVDERDGRWVIVDGEPTWEGQGLEVCQAQVDEWGITAFLVEGQHEVSRSTGGMYDHVSFEHRATAPDLLRTVVWVDPAVTDTDRSDSMAYECDGVDTDGVIWRLASWEQRSSPEDALRRAIRCALRYGADKVGVETDQGGDTWRSVYREAARAVSVEDGVPLYEMPRFDQDKAGAGHGPKAHRQSQMLADYERPGRVVHVLGDGTDVLERALRRFGRTKPFDLADAAYWSWKDLRSRGEARLAGGARRNRHSRRTVADVRMGRWRQ